MSIAQLLLLYLGLYVASTFGLTKAIMRFFSQWSMNKQFWISSLLMPGAFFTYGVFYILKRQQTDLYKASMAGPDSPPEWLGWGLLGATIFGLWAVGALCVKFTISSRNIE